MALNRGDIIDVFFEFPKTKNTTTHPAIIISNQEVYDADDGYICVIMTSSEEFKDKFTFELTDAMLQKANTKAFSQARCHMVTFVHEKHIIDKYPKNTLKPNAVERLISHINEVSFSDDY